MTEPELELLLWMAQQPFRVNSVALTWAFYHVIDKYGILPTDKAKYELRLATTAQEAKWNARLK